MNGDVNEAAFREKTQVSVSYNACQAMMLRLECPLSAAMAPGRAYCKLMTLNRLKWLAVLAPILFLVVLEVVRQTLAPDLFRAWPGYLLLAGVVLLGALFFAEAIFIAIYVYGWDRLAPKTHFLTGIPIVVTGFTGSLFVIAVNGWMNQPTGFKIANGEVTDIEPLKARARDRRSSPLSRCSWCSPRSSFSPVPRRYG